MSSLFNRIGLLSMAAVTLSAQPSGPSEAATLDFLFFKERVQPLFLEARSGQASCATCHVRQEPLLAKLTASATGWDNEQSRRNFESWKAAVVPGKPTESAALLRPLAGAPGTDQAHAGGKPWATTADAAWQTLAAWVRGRRFGGVAIPADAGSEFVFQLSADGDGVHVIDAQSRQVIGLVEGAESPGGVAAAPDGSRLYASNVARSSLDVVDFKTLAVFKQISVSGRPTGVASAKDGSKIYVGVESGAVDVIDAAGLTRVNTIALDRPVNSILATPDGTHLVVSSSESDQLTVVDLEREALSWTLKLDAGIGAVAFVPNGDGSTRDILVQLDGLRGFAVVDFATRAHTQRINLPAAPGGERLEGPFLSAGGLAVSSNLEFPSERVLWVGDKAYGAVVAFGVPERCYPRRTLRPGERCDWEVVGTIDVGSRPESLAPMPDARTMYVALADVDQTAVLDVETMTVVDRVPVGGSPGRNLAATMSVR